MRGLFAGIMSVIPRPFPGPGAMNGALRVNTAPPSYDVRGSGRPVFGQLAMTAPQIVTTNTQVLQGFGGLYTGQFAVAPLIQNPLQNSVVVGG